MTIISRGNILTKIQEKEKSGDLKGQQEILKNILVGRGIISSTQLFDAVKTLKQNIKEKLNKSGQFDKLYIVDQDNYRLVIKNSTNNQIIKTIDLPKEEGFKLTKNLEWSPIGSVNIDIFNYKDEKGNIKLEKLGELVSPQVDRYGIIVGKNYSYLNSDDFSSKYLDINIKKLYYGKFSLEDIPTLPIDIFISRKLDYLVLSDRGAGKIHVIDTNTDTLLKSFKIREPRNKKAINLDFKTDTNSIYIVNNTDNNIITIDLNNGELKTHIINKTVIISNIEISYDNTEIYITSVDSTNKSLSVMTLDSTSFEVKNILNINGEAFSSYYDPFDQLITSFDSNFAFVMTSVNQPMLFTPLITLIDLKNNKIIEEITLDNNNKPFNLASIVEQVFPENISLINTLLHIGYINKEEMEKALGIYREDESFDSFLWGRVDSSDTKTSDIPIGGAVATTERIGSQKEICTSDILKKISATKVKEKIIEYCVNFFKKEKKIDLTEHEMAMDRLDSAASKARNELIDFKETIIKVSDIVEGHDLELEMSQDQLISMVSSELQQTSVKPKLQAVCQECKTLLLPNGRCPKCDPPEKGEEQEGMKFRIGTDHEIPSHATTDQKVKKEKQIRDVVQELIDSKKSPIDRKAMLEKMNKYGSSKTKDNLTEIRLLIVDKTRNKILQINREKKVFWQYGGIEKGDKEKLNSPNLAEVIPDNKVIITDTNNNRVLIVNRTNNEIEWEMSENLKRPLAATRSPCGNIIISDTDNSRVIEVDINKNIIWTFETKKPVYAMKLVNNNFLITDSYNHVVQEVNTNKDVVWQYGILGQKGHSIGTLNSPEQAKRLKNNNTLISDTGNNRVIEVNYNKDIIWEFNGTPKGGIKQIFLNPSNVYRLSNGNTIIIHSNNRKIIELDKETKLVAHY